MSKKYNIAVVGATGNVGRQIISGLSDRGFAVDNIYAVASAQSLGQQISYGDQNLDIDNLEGFNFSGVDIVFLAVSSKLAQELAPKITKHGAVVIDNSSYWRQNAKVPLVIPEINPLDLKHYGKLNIIANPNCSTIQMLMALHPLDQQVPIKRVVVATYQSVAGAGKDAMDELYQQTKARYVFKELVPEHFPKVIAFNCIPQIDSFLPSGLTKEEFKMQAETNKILGRDVPVNASCVRVPTFGGHAESVNVEFEDEITVEDAIEILADSPGIMVTDSKDNQLYATPMDANGEDLILISRLREDNTVEHGLNMWLVGDPLRKGAATNAIQIAEELIKNYKISN
ncbi:MAG: aspartate-semialdehyde dehydrogenase [Pseudomonadota bacterium]